MLETVSRTAAGSVISQSHAALYVLVCHLNLSRLITDMLLCSLFFLIWLPTPAVELRTVNVTHDLFDPSVN